MEIPYITKEKGISGTIKQSPDYFIVEEIPVYDASGEGEHLFVNITKREMTTKYLEIALARLFNLTREKLGSAGLKDKNAITTQTISMLLPKANLEEVKEKIESLGVKVNWMKYHNNKLKPGHLFGNKFTIVITDLENKEKALEQAKKIAEEIKQKGVPNYYGEQRFGMDGDNAEKALQILKGELKVRDKWLRNFLLSSYQSYLCNLYLAERVNLGFQLLEGDICKKHDTGGLFEVTDLEAEAIRYENKEISFTAPMFGDKLWKAKGEAGNLENSIVAKSGLTEEQINRLGAGTRRLGRLIINDLDVKLVGLGLEVSFSLPKGAFATIVLREFMKN